MFERYTKASRAVVEAAYEEARALGSPSIEAEHLLLALTRSPGAGAALAAGGLDHDGLLEALELEFATALETVGVSAAGFGLPPAAAVAGRMRFGTSGKAVLERGIKLAVARGDKRLEAGHLALAVLRPSHGTVPRALAAAGVDARELTDRVAATL
jgi:ATP-dependent Clp protease ATP-binding subunit ClpA